MSVTMISYNNYTFVLHFAQQVVHTEQNECTHKIVSYTTNTFGTTTVIKHPIQFMIKSGHLVIMYSLWKSRRQKMRYADGIHWNKGLPYYKSTEHLDSG